MNSLEALQQDKYIIAVFQQRAALTAALEVKAYQWLGFGLR
ncbi:MAG: hypothetical protein ACI9CE_001127 [Flavobacterium sp.]|jgi:hypothetical protein